MSGIPGPRIITGLPPSTKDSPRADFKLNEFDKLIVSKGYRMFWSRASLCPCTGNDQTEQSDPTCPLCKGDPYYYFLPDAAIGSGDRKDVFGNDVVLNVAQDAIQIYVLMTSMTKDIKTFERFGEWVSGTSRVTVQPQNKIGYRDRLISVDSVMSWSQIIDSVGSAVIPVVGERDKTGLRYPLVSINELRAGLFTTATPQGIVYKQGRDYELTAAGAISWIVTPPASGTRLTVHGTARPVWIVMDHMHTYRDTQLSAGSGVSRQVVGKLPLQAVVKLDFMINP